MKNLIEVSKDYILDNGVNNLNGLFSKLKDLFKNIINGIKNAIKSGLAKYILPLLAVLGIAVAPWVGLVLAAVGSYMKVASYEKKKKMAEQARIASQQLLHANAVALFEKAKKENTAHTLGKFLEMWCYNRYTGTGNKFIDDYGQEKITDKKMAEVCGQVFDVLIEKLDAIPSLEMLDWIMYNGISLLYSQGGVESLTYEKIKNVIDNFVDKTLYKNKKNNNDMYIDVLPFYNNADKNIMSGIVNESLNKDIPVDQKRKLQDAINKQKYKSLLEPGTTQSNIDIPSGTAEQTNTDKININEINWATIPDEQIEQLLKSGDLTVNAIVTSPNKNAILDRLAKIRSPYSSPVLKYLITQRLKAKVIPQ